MNMNGTSLHLLHGKWCNVDGSEVIDPLYPYPRHPVIFLADDWGVQSPPEHSIYVPLPFSEGDWIPRA